MYRVLLVKDDVKQAQFLSNALREHGFYVELAHNIGRALQMIHGAEAWDVVIVDWRLPDGDWQHALREARTAITCKNAHIIMMTVLDSVDLKLEAFGAGADDFLVKPVDVRELVARIHAAARHTGQGPHNSLGGGSIYVDLHRMRVTVDRTEVSLTKGEYALLVYLMVRQPRVVARSELIAALKDTHHDTGTKPVDVEMSRLRGKLNRAADHLRTVRGVGYAFDPPRNVRPRSHAGK